MSVLREATQCISLLFEKDLVEKDSYFTLLGLKKIIVDLWESGKNLKSNRNGK